MEAGGRPLGPKLFGPVNWRLIRDGGPISLWIDSIRLAYFDRPSNRETPYPFITPDKAAFPPKVGILSGSGIIIINYGHGINRYPSEDAI